MFGMFNSSAEKRAKKYPLSREAGEYASATDIYTTAQGSGDWNTKKQLVLGCVAAFEAGRPENLRSFVMGYLEFKRAEGYVSKVEKSGIDDGFVGLICDPVMLLLEKQKEPASVLEILTRDMSPYYKQLLLDLVLRRAAMTNSWMVLPVVLQAGGNANTGHGRPLLNAARHGYLDITRQLLQAGADPALARQLIKNEKNATDTVTFEDTLLRAAAGATPPVPMPASAPSLPDSLEVSPLIVRGREPISKPVPKNRRDQG